MKFGNIRQQVFASAQTNNASRLMKEIIYEIGLDLTELLKFSYELLKFDHKQIHAYDLLIGQVFPSTLVKIILSNEWDPYAEKMQVKEECYFNIFADQDHFLNTGSNSRTGKKVHLESTAENIDKLRNQARFKFLMCSSRKDQSIGLSVIHSGGQVLASRDHECAQQSFKSLIFENPGKEGKHRWLLQPVFAKS